MPAIKPVYRLTVFAPRNEDPTETTVLTPIGGAAHSDPFVVTTLQGVGGSKPYLGIPKGRQGSLDVVTKRVTTGNLMLPVFNPRVAAGGSNATRWSDAFLGDALGRTRLKGCRFTLERSLDGTAGSLAPYFAGRIRNTSTSRPLWWDLDLKDFADDLNRKIFVGAPHPSIAYASPASILPAGVPQPFANFAVTDRLAATLSWNIDAGFLAFSTSQAPVLGVITKATHDAEQGSALRVVKVVKPDTTVGYFQWVHYLFGDPELPVAGPATEHRRFQWIPLAELPTGDPRYTAHAGWTGDVSAVVFIDGPPSKDVPLLVNDVHPIQYLADMVDGKFSCFPADTTLRPLGTREATSWAALLADPSFGTMRDIAVESVKLNDYAEKFIFQRYNIAWRPNAIGQLVLIDLRRSAALSAAVTLTDDDLVTSVEPAWNDSRDGAITAVEVTYYLDETFTTQEILKSADTYPALPTTMIRSTPSTVLIPNDLSTYRDVGEKIVKIDARGSRAAMGELSPTGASRADVLVKEIRAAIADFLRPYVTGTITAPVSYRMLGNAASVHQGTYAIVQHSKLPDPATNLRGCDRLMLCINRDEQDGRIAITWLDCGAHATAGVPTLTSIAAIDENTIDVTTTVNAAGDPVEVWTAITPTSVAVRPAESAAAWVYAGATAFLRARPLPSGMRIWVRARSQSAGSALKLPSAWVFPVTPAAGYLDLAGLTAPSALVASNLFANRVDVAWTVGETDIAHELFLVAGGVPGTWTDAMKLRDVDAGATKARVGFLAPSTTYTIGVRHLEPSGGTSPMATVTFTTSAVHGIAPDPFWIANIVGGVAT
jgi:hypothetical protein